MKVLTGSLAWSGGPWPDRLTLDRGDETREYVPQAELDRLRAVGEEMATALEWAYRMGTRLAEPAWSAQGTQIVGERMMKKLAAALKSYREAVPE